MRNALTIGILVAIGASSLALGVLLGEATSTPEEEAALARAEATEEARALGYRETYRPAMRAGHRIGRARGAEQGRTEGRSAGLVDGEAAADAELAAIAQAEAEAAQLAAEQEAAERQANCGAPYFPPDYCPTDAELEQTSLAERLCGPGHHDEAAAHGISCYPGHLP